MCALGLQRILQALFPPLLPSKVDCLLRAFTCHAFPYNLHVYNGRRLHIVISSVDCENSDGKSSSAKVISDVWEFWEICRGKNWSVVCAPRSWPSMEWLRTCVTIYWKCIHCVTKKLRPVQKRSRELWPVFWDLDSVVKLTLKRSLAAVRRFKGQILTFVVALAYIARPGFL